LGEENQLAYLQQGIMRAWIIYDRGSRDAEIFERNVKMQISETG
jgi:hypothetical protein